MKILIAAIAILAMLIENAYTLEAPKYKTIHEAVMNGDLNDVNRHIDRDIDLNVKDENGKTALHHAVNYAVPKIVERLLSLGADVNAQDIMGETPLHYATARRMHNIKNMDYKQCADLLVAKGADPRITNNKGKAPFELKSYLGEWGAEPKLCWAALVNHRKFAEEIIQNGADINNKKGEHPLRIAARYGNKEVAELLINKGADINQSKALVEAAYWGHYDIVKMLIDSKANINEKTYYGHTALYGAIEQKHFEIVKLIVASGADVNKTLIDSPPLHVAVMRDDIDVIRFLLDKGADINAKNNKGETPLVCAIKCNSMNAAEVLIKNGAKE